MKKILIITGGAGFIGFNFVKHFLPLRGYENVIFIDKMGYATKNNKSEYYRLTATSEKFINIEMNINNLYAFPIPNKVKNSEFDIVNFASESHVDNSISSPYSIYNDNACIVSNLISWAGKENISKFVHISTDEVYGDLDYNLKDDYSKWFKPDSPFLPNNPYAASKAAQDCYLRSMNHTFGLNVVTVRMANQFGPHQHHEKMLPATIKRAVGGLPIKIYGEGKNIRQWTPVSQTVKHIYNILMDDKVNNTTIHLGASQSLLTNNEVVDMWRGILKDNHNIDTTVEYIEDRKGHDKMYAIQPSVEYVYGNIKDEFVSSIDYYVNYKYPV